MGLAKRHFSRLKNQVLSSIDPKYTSDWTILVLAIDRSSEMVGQYLQKRYRGIIFADGLYSTNSFKEGMVKALSDIEIPNRHRVLGVWGSGMYHHFTYGLCRAMADRRSKSYAYMHFDHHGDCGNYGSSWLFGCAAFVSSIIRGSNAQTARFVGNKGFFEEKGVEGKFSEARYVLEKDLRTMDIENRVEYLLEGTPRDVYLSVDLDVMNRKEINTHYRGHGENDGNLTSKELLTMLSLIGERKNVIGADVLGFNGDGDLGLQLYDAIVGTLIKKT